MEIDDKLQKVLDNLSEESHFDASKEVLNVVIASIPHAGSAIASLSAGRAKRRILERATEVFRAMKERLEQLGESKIDKSFFESEEFQTLLALALEQIQTAHDKAKLKMLACGLANGGVQEFSCDNRKELFIRILRDLSPNHVRVLAGLLPPARSLNAGPDLWPVSHEPHGEDLAILQNLASHGLVEDFLKSGRTTISGLRYGSQWTESEAVRAVNEALKAAPSRSFRISKFGLDFLKYLGVSGAPAFNGCQSE
jgi:hypothetical protein